MPALFTFLFKVNIALVLFCLGYYLVLRRLTFYTLNRVYLITAILFSSLYPWMNINNFVQKHQQLTAPVRNVIIRWKAPAENLVKPHYWYWAEVVFWIGVVLLAARLVMQLISLYRLHRQSEPGEVHNYPVRLISGDVSPFSFWRNIYINPNKLSTTDLEKVLEHEHIHVSEWHTLDILLAELSTVFYWFNPGIWLVKKAVKENIEFITDRKILQKGADSKQYQYSLLNVSMAGSPNNLVNNFNISTIKKRIIMMNARRSSRFSLTRYMVIVPAVVLLLLVFNISKAEITKKGIFTFHSITAAIKNAAIANHDKPVTQAVKQVTTIVAVPKFKINAKGDTIYAGKSKDGKKTMLITSDKTKDSVGYVINGSKATRSDLEALDPGKVMSLDMVPAEEAKKYVDFTLDKSEILFVTTDDSEKGKSLKERMDKDMNGGVLVRSRDMAVSGDADVAPPPPPPGMGYSIATTTVSSDVAPKVSIHGNVKADTKVTKTYTITAAPKASTTTSVMVLADGTKKVTKDVYVIKSDQGAVRINGEDVISPKIVTDNANVKDFKIRIDKLDHNNDETTIDDFNNDVLYVVNGKIVKSLKGVSASDISSISVLKDEKAKKKYGDRGKNGVIEVTTKKGK